MNNIYIVYGSLKDPDDTDRTITAPTNLGAVAGALREGQSPLYSIIATDFETAIKYFEEIRYV